MDKELLRKYIVEQDMDLRDVMKRMDANQGGVVFVVNKSEQLVGSITNGDVRKRLMETGNLYACASEVMNTSPKVLKQDQMDEIMVMFEKFGIITALPVVDKENKIQDIVFRVEIDSREKEIRKTKLYGVPVIIMAGGKGTRLYPYTKILPKPLIPIGEIPIVERIIERFEAFGVNDLYMTVNYKKEMIKSYFSEIKLQASITYVEEDKPLGTGGSIKLIKQKFDKPIVVTNCDILIDADYSEIYRHHKLMGNMMTIVAATKSITIPYGVLRLGECGSVMEMEEKPQLSYFVNTGMYIISPEALEKIPEDTFFHMTDLADILMKTGSKVGIYPIREENFLDMGEFEELRRMEEKLAMEER